MEQNFNTINLEYIETKKTSMLIKIIAFILVAIFILFPLAEFSTLFEFITTPSYYSCGYLIK